MDTVNYHDIALDILFTGRLDLNKYGIVYRASKSKGDVTDAIRKAKKNGQYKTEAEISMLEIYLKDIFKKAKQ